MLLLTLLILLAQGQNFIVIHLKDGVDPTEFGKENGLELVESLEAIMPGYYKFKPAEGKKTRTMHELKSDKRQVVWAKEQVPRMRYKRKIEEDPLYYKQWHLHGTDSPMACIDAHEGHNYSGKGVTIGIVDDGLEHSHPDIQPNYAAALSHNWNGGVHGVGDPTPTYSHDGHGTSAAGVAAAARHNGVCGRGVAYGAKVAGLRLIAGAVTDLNEATALCHEHESIDIYSNSWGPADSGYGMDAPGHMTRAVLARYAGAHVGRKGKGSIYIWASGNGRDHYDSCAYDGYANNPYVNAIGALDHTGKQAWYSEGCSALMAVMPSSGAGKGITTCDLKGARGYEPGDCTNTFGGTSSAAPTATGVVALMLEKNPALTWRDVKHLIALGATQVDEEDEDGWHTNANGYHHNNKYGFGLLKVPKLLQVMDHYDPVPKEQKQVLSATAQVTEGTHVILDFHLNHTGIRFIENVIAMVSVQHPHRGQLRISIQSPTGDFWSILADYRRLDRGANYPPGGWHLNTVAFWGETQADGIWKLKFENLNGAAHVGKILSARIGVFGF